MRRFFIPTLVAALAVAATVLPAPAAAERVITRKGEVIVGTPRFEQDQVVVVREDGTEVRLPRTQVERIELTEEEAEPEAAPPAGSPSGQAAEPPAPPPAEQPRQPSGPPAWRPRTPPPPPTTPPPPPGYYRAYAPPPPPPVYRERAYDQNGFALTGGYHRGLAIGGEWQVRMARNFGLGLGAQAGIEPGPDDGDEFTDDTESYGTFGFTGRAYVGRQHRLALEAGFGLNAIDPDLAPDCDIETESCAEYNFGPEFSAGYQFISDRGFVFETLFGFAVITNDRYRDAHEPLNPLFQMSFGYLFH